MTPPQWLEPQRPPAPRRSGPLIALLIVLLAAATLTLWLALGEPEPSATTRAVLTNPGTAPEAESPEEGVGDSPVRNPANPPDHRADAVETPEDAQEETDSAPDPPDTDPGVEGAGADESGSPDRTRDTLAAGEGGRRVYGRFTTFGERADGETTFVGTSVAIGGDVAAAIAAIRDGANTRSVVRVFERRGDTWIQSDTLTPPEYSPAGPTWVGIAEGRIVTVGTVAVGTRTPTIRSYVRNAGEWEIESVCPLPEPTGSNDHGPSFALTPGYLVGRRGSRSLTTWKRGADGWFQLNETSVKTKGLAGSWIAAHGGVVVSCSANPTRATLSFLRRRQGERLRLLSTRDEALPLGTRGALARDAWALVTTSDVGEIRIYERELDDWRLVVRTTEPRAPVSGVIGFTPVGADGDLAVIAATGGSGGTGGTAEIERFVLLERRQDGWVHAELPVAIVIPGRRRTLFSNCANVAVSGRSVIVGTRWDSVSGGRVVLFDVNDADLARAEPLPAIERD